MEEYWIKESIKNESFDSYYDIVNKIGNGATCSVYLCVRKNTNLKFAVKLISKKMGSKVVKTEVGILLKLKHPNIIRLYELYESSTEVHMILEYVSGGEMFDRIVSRGHYTEKDASRCVKEMLEAVCYLHENGVIHRDLKPENLLYDTEEESNLKLADFGIAKILEDDIHTMTVCGTPGYCAPEVLLGMSYSKPVDLWSVGVITYILLCGFEPFYDEDDKVMFKKIIKIDYSFISPWWDSVSINAKDLITKLLVKDPSKRLTAKQALRHPWVRGDGVSGNPLEQTQSNLKEFNAKRKMKASMFVTSVVGHLMKMCHHPTGDDEKVLSFQNQLLSASTFNEGMNNDAFETSEAVEAAI